MPLAEQQIHDWLNRSFPSFKDRSVVVRFVENDEIQTLNHQYRDQNKPTNILSFPYEPMTEVEDSTHLGDLVIAVPVMLDEAKQQQKSVLDHFAHILIHGVLHLQGYDHEEADQAKEMETLEIELLQELDIANPY